ncbi:PEP/pyruvate-binding domain-containing protein [Phycisphaerales bacterium AB-hyl4]|uniref:PEP/pyruvate-binding domain-containing protein n=1 Tax=Natronomicrosphaera hydrolytica TaxID=3242702 RepID=A0ABV4U613_9BACT
MLESNSRWTSTGLVALDEVLDGLRVGDNVVWLADAVTEYARFVRPFVEHTQAEGRRAIYMRFGQHAPLVADDSGATVYELNAHHGFESFTARVYQIITDEGPDAFYIFDCLTDLLDAWATDRMIGDFFRVICPYLYKLDTVAYFCLLRTRHAYRTIAQIRETTQLLLGLNTSRGQLHVHPMKVWRRASPTMFLPHVCKGDRFLPVANSDDATRLSRDLVSREVLSAHRHLDSWDRLFLDAERLCRRSTDDPTRHDMVAQLCRVMIGCDERMLALARRHLSLEQLLEIKSRLIGTGFIGGKAVGMLLARQILLAEPDAGWTEQLEPHDSFYVGSDVFYGYLVHNGWWDLFMQQKTERGYYTAAAQLHEKMLHGKFSGDVKDALLQMLEYFGQYPLVIRSSSLLEDGFGNAFAGKYESYFRVNRGTPEQRYAQVEEAVRRIFASAMSADALAYRRQRGLDQLEEPMALLCQRVSGAYRDHYYFPDVAGVGMSRNPFVWHREMDPQAGMLRLVLGLGTRAVDRVEGDYARTVALDQPGRQPHKDAQEARAFSQHDVDVLDLESNALRTISFRQLLDEGVDMPLDRVAARCGDTTAAGATSEPLDGQPRLLSFEPLLKRTGFAARMQRMLKTLEQVYETPVDVEFTANFTREGVTRINLVQCRPMQTRGAHSAVAMPSELRPEQVLFRSTGDFMGGNVAMPIHRVIVVEPEGYVALSPSERYEVARLVGRLNREITDRQRCTAMLIGPGRWGTSTPALGVPVRFSEINMVSVLVEVAFEAGGLMPDLSFGTHFFQDLVETDTFYAALFPEKAHCDYRPQWLKGGPTASTEALADASAEVAEVVRVYETGAAGLRLFADVVTQAVVCCDDVCE